MSTRTDRETPPVSPRMVSRVLEGMPGAPILASGITMSVEQQSREGLVGRTPRRKERDLTPVTAMGRAHPERPRLLWVGDAVVPTGFATVTHSILAHLCQDWQVVVSGVNYDGGPHSFPYTILPARQGGDMWGMNRFAALCAEYAPDAVVINSDWWHVAALLDHAPEDVFIAAYMPVDGAHLNPVDIRKLHGLAAAVWYTEFGHQEARKAGFVGERHVIPHGLDADLWQSMDKIQARRELALPVPPGAFLVGNINRNQPRKRLDVTISNFAHWIQSRNVTDAWLLLHCAQKDTGWNLRGVADFYGVADRLLLTGPEDLRKAGGPASLLPVYNALDVQVSTTLGEGWGLTTMEGMACGVPQLVPAWAGLGEWAEPALKVPCHTKLVHPEINTVGALPDQETFVAQLDRLYRDPAARTQLSQRGAAFVRQPQFGWDAVAAQFDVLLRRALPSATAKSDVPARLVAAA